MKSASLRRSAWERSSVGDREALISPIWGSNRAFRVDRPTQKLTKFQRDIVLDQKFTPAHFQPIEETP